MEKMSSSSSSENHHIPSALLPSYRIYRILGEGSFGRVVQAFKKDTGEAVAIKVLKKQEETLSCKSVRDYLIKREVEALRCLGNHPNIIQLKEVIKDDQDDSCMVFEYMHYNLNQSIRSGASFSESKIRSYCFQILSGLHHMHSSGYIHRDLKPENLLLKGEQIKIADLGSARDFTSPSGPCFTEYITTRWYRAPEVLLFGGYYESAVDMWALGAIMAEMYMRLPLFMGSDTEDQIFQICHIRGTPEHCWPLGFQLAQVRNNFVFAPFSKIHLSILMPNASEAAIDLMDSLLSWDPLKRRPSAFQALQHRFFQPYNNVAPTTFGSNIATNRTWRDVLLSGSQELAAV